MTEETRKKLEEATKKFLLPYEKLYHPALHLGFMQGAELGYKEACMHAKEWLKENADKYCSTISGELYFEEDEMLADFETDMNKLWED